MVEGNERERLLQRGSHVHAEGRRGSLGIDSLENHRH